MLHSVFERALLDRLVTFNTCAHTELPKRVKNKARTLTPDDSPHRPRPDPKLCTRVAPEPAR